jgi:hypothetical protein
MIAYMPCPVILRDIVADLGIARQRDRPEWRAVGGRGGQVGGQALPTFWLAWALPASSTLRLDSLRAPALHLWRVACTGILSVCVLIGEPCLPG